MGSISVDAGAADRGRTDTEFPPADFKSAMSAIPSQRQNKFARAATLFKQERDGLKIRRVLEVPPGFEPGVKALQARALPLGYGTVTVLPPRLYNIAEPEQKRKRFYI